MATVTINETVLATALTSKTEDTIAVISATGFAAGNIVFINREAMKVRGNYVSGTAIPVIRGVEGTVAGLHDAGDIVYTGEPKEFYRNDKHGYANTDNEYALPHINLRTGRISDIAGDNWYERALGVSGSVLTLTPTASDSPGVNMIPAGVDNVRLGANVNGANDWVTLPPLADVPNGHVVTIVAGAVGCEVRTPSASAEEINSEDCDGTKEYILAATEIHRFTKIDGTIGWMGQGFTAIGAVATAIVPD